jgi:hypothetical protein
VDECGETLKNSETRSPISRTYSSSGVGARDPKLNKINN